MTKTITPASHAVNTAPISAAPASPAQQDAPAAQPARECLQQSAKNESLARELTLLANVQDERYPNFRIIALEAAAALQAAPPAPAGVAVPECLTCSDHGAVGNILTAEPCPDCTPQEHATQLAVQGQDSP